MASLRRFYLLSALLLNVCYSEGSLESKYELQITDRILDTGIFKTVVGCNRMHCAALCLQEPCTGFGFVSQNCYLLNTVINEENCETFNCSDAPGVKVYMKQVDVVTTTTQLPSTTTAATTEATTTTTEKTTTTTKFPTTTTTTTELTTTTTKPTTSTKKPTTTTMEPTTTTTKPTTTTTTEKPTTTTTTEKPTTTTTTTEPTPTTTKQPTTTTTKQTTTTTSVSFTTTTTVPSTTTTTEAAGIDIHVTIKCTAGDLVLQGLVMAETAFFQDDNTKDVCFTMGAAKAFASSERKTFAYGGTETAVCKGFKYPAVTGMEAEVGNGKLLKLIISCAELNEDVVDKEKEVATQSSAIENKKVVCAELQTIQSIRAKRADEFTYEVLVTCLQLKRPSSASSLG